MSDSVETVFRALLAATMVVASAYLGFALLQWVARRYSDRYPTLVSLVDQAQRPFRFLVGLIAAQVVSTRLANVEGEWIDSLEHGLQIATIFALVWLAITAVKVVEEQVFKNDGKRDRDPIDRRRFQTQITFLRRLIVASIIAVGVIAVLLTFPSVASLGTTLVASAGLLSIVAGLAAQTSLTNVFAGIQLALSDSIRVGDVVVVNSQIGTDTTDTIGTVSELTLTHVEIVRLNGRVLILPSAYFIIQPFENLTRKRNQLVGTITVDVDWGTPVEKIRNEVTEILETSGLWNGLQNYVLVTNILGTTRQIQIGMSAANLDNLIALQALVRERITEFLINELPESLVRTRTEALVQPAPALAEEPPSVASHGDDESEPLQEKVKRTEM
jgi:small-conductance mechanosensitive channel